MSNATKFSEEIKTRVPKLVKRKLKAVADARHLDLSDIAREAYREFLAKPENATLLQEKA